MPGSSAVEDATGTLGELFALASDLERAIGQLLDESASHYNDVNANSSVVFVGWNPHRWNKLDGPGQAALGVARKLGDRWRELARCAIGASVPSRLREFDREERTLQLVLDREKNQSKGVPGGSIEVHEVR